MTDLLPEPGTDSFLPTRQSLLSRLRNCQEQAGWREFFDAYWRLITNVARKSSLADQIDDPAADALKLSFGFARICAYHGRR